MFFIKTACYWKCLLRFNHHFLTIKDLCQIFMWSLLKMITCLLSRINSKIYRCLNLFSHFFLLLLFSKGGLISEGIFTLVPSSKMRVNHCPFLEDGSIVKMHSEIKPPLKSFFWTLNEMTIFLIDYQNISIPFRRSPYGPTMAAFVCFCLKSIETNLDFRYQHVENLKKQRHPLSKL